MKRVLYKLLIVLFVGIFTVACAANSSSNSDSETKKSEGNNNSDGNDTDRPTIELFTNEHASWPTNEDWLVWGIMEDGGNMNIDLTIANEPYDESVNLEIASGDLADLFRMPYQSGNRYGAEGAFVNILDHIDKMPNLQAWMEQYPDYARAALSHDGKMYVSPNEGMGETSRMLWLYREDIFDEHELSHPKDWDELHTVLKTLKEIYPDSYPFGFRTGIEKLTSFAASFGVEGDYYYDYEKDEWRYGPIEDNYAVLVEYLNTFFDEGLIPSDFLTLDTTTWQELMSTDVSFITHDYIARIDMFNEANQGDNPTYSMLNMPPPAGFPGGEQFDYFSSEIFIGFSIASTSDHIDKLIQYIDWTFSPEGRDALSWGVEGETYEEVDGEKLWIPSYTSPEHLRTETGLSLFGTYSWFDYESHMVLFSDEVREAYETDAQYDAPPVPRPAFTEEEQEVIAIKGEEINKHRDAEISKFIIGNRDLDEWDDYIQEIEGLGVQELIDIYAAAYQRMLDVELE